MFEFLVKTRKWLCIGLYKSPSQNENYFLDILSKVLSKQTCQYENVMLIGDFNLTVNNKNLGVFMNTFNLDSLINKPTCFQSANPTCIDLILTNKKSLKPFSRYGFNTCLHLSRKGLLDVQGSYFLACLGIFGVFSYVSVKRVVVLVFFTS